LDRTVFSTVMQRGQLNRYLLNQNHNSKGRPTLPHARSIESNQMHVSYNNLQQRIPRRRRQEYCFDSFHRFMGNR